MLSDLEIENIHRTLASNPPKNIAKRLEDELSQHNYSLKYPPFTSLSHHRQFLNRQTNEQVLNQIIDIAKDSTTILLDTESTPVYRQPNRPSLIQFQLIPNDTLPMVVIVEVNHLPPINTNAFKQMKEFFRIVLDSDKVIYTWGTIEELEPFVQFGLFTTKQIKQSDNEDLQSIFKDYWRRCHKHKPDEDCKCEKCLRRKPNQKWKLLDAVAHQLNEWLDKRHTCSPFDIGLDPKLKQLRPEQLKYRNTLTNYAANDVLSMEKLMSAMQERISPSELTQTLTKQTKTTSRIIHQGAPDSTEEMTITLLIHASPLLINLSHQSISEFEQTNHQVEREQTERIQRQFETKQHRSERTDQQHRSERTDQQHRSERTDHQHRSEHIQQRHETEPDRPKRIDERHRTERTDRQYQRHRYRRMDQQRRSERINQLYQLERSNQQHQEEEHLPDTKRKTRNRISTIKQRQRNYRHEIIRRGIDPRFKIEIVKEILYRFNVPYTAVNISKSKMTGRKSLYIGIEDRYQLHEYEHRTRKLFTTDYYNEFRARNRF